MLFLLSGYRPNSSSDLAVPGHLLPGRRDFFDACGIGGTADLRIKSCTLCEASPKIHKHDAKYVQVHGQTAADLLI